MDLNSIKNLGYTKIWGEHSLSIGEIVGLIIGFAVILFHALGAKWSIWVGLIIIAAAMALF